MKRHGLWIAILLVSLAGIGSIFLKGLISTPASPDNQTESLQKISSATPLQSVKLPRIRLAEQKFPGLDPDEVGWETETFHDLAAIQLKHLSKILEKAGKLPDENYRTLFTQDVSCKKLRPNSLKTIYQDTAQGLRIQRQANGDSAQLEYAGPQGMSEALKELVAPLSSLPLRRVKLKIFRVVSKPELIETTVYYHSSSQGKMSVRQNATWKITWRSGENAALPRIQRIEVLNDSFEEIILHKEQGSLFSDCTASILAGNASFSNQLLRSQNYWAARIEYQYGMDMVAFHGMALGDVNNDGLDDLYLCMPGGLPNRLYIQNSDGTATDYSAQSGLDFFDFSRHGLFVDLDNDGDQDLALLLNESVLFFENDGSGKFKRRGELGLASSSYSMSAVDFDNDRDLDIFITGRDLAATEDQTKSLLGNPIPYHDANNGGPNALLTNQGKFQFINVTKQVGLDVNNRRFSQAASWEDYDNDGDMDLYVANDFGRNNLYENQGGNFIDIAAEAGVEDISAGMSVSWGDYNNDGLMDLYIGNMFSSAGNRVAYQRIFHEHLSSETRAQIQRHARGNTLFQNLGNGNFKDVSEAMGVTMGRWAWSSHLFDLNNDGWQDIVVANGFVTNEEEQDL